MAATKRKARSAPAPSSLAELDVAPEPAVKPKRGLFDGVVKIFRGRMRPNAALFAILAGAAVADGRVVAEEDEELNALTHRSKNLAKLDAAALARIRSEVFARLDRSKRADLVQHAALSLQSPSMRLSAFAHACDIVFADRLILKSEREFLKTLIIDLKLENAEAEAMLRAIRAKNAH